MLALRLPADLEKRLDLLARTTGRTKSFFVRQAIVEHLDDLEDVFVAEKRLADLESGRSTTTPVEEVMRRYGLEG